MNKGVSLECGYRASKESVWSVSIEQAKSQFRVRVLSKKGISLEFEN
jgi:hypothetical protein